MASNKLDALPSLCQEYTEWCWAAIATAIAKFYDASSTITQTFVACKVFPNGDCCNNGGSTPCNQPAHLEAALEAAKHPASRLPRSLQPSELTDLINNNKPVCVRVGSKLGGHFLAVKGFDDTAPSNLYLLVCDPEAGECITTFDALLTSYPGYGKWTDTYLTR
jgi:Papain-like cysteine protease AvrRpt2